MNCYGACDVLISRLQISVCHMAVVIRPRQKVMYKTDPRTRSHIFVKTPGRHKPNVSDAMYLLL
jgi:hypothetical protein